MNNCICALAIGIAKSKIEKINNCFSCFAKTYGINLRVVGKLRQKIQNAIKNSNYMRFIVLLTIILLSSCENNKETTVNRQQAIKKEMEQVKAFYYKKLDSLESVKEADTISAKHMEIAGIAEGKKTATLLKLQKEYDSLEVELKKY